MVVAFMLHGAHWDCDKSVFRMKYSGQLPFSVMYADGEWISVCVHLHVIQEFMGKWTMELDVTH